MHEFVRIAVTIRRLFLIRDFKKYPKRFYGYIRNLQTVKNMCVNYKHPIVLLLTLIKKQLIFCASTFILYSRRKLSVTDLTVTAPCHEQFSVSFDDCIVLRKLQLLKIDKSPGPDDIHPVILKNCASAVVKPLSAIFQKSYSTGEVPAECRLETGCHITTV